MSIIKAVKKYITLECLFIKSNFIATSKYGLSYFLSIFYEFINGIMNMIYFYFIFENVDAIGTWNKENVFLLVAIGYFIDVICVLLFIGAASIPEYISTGLLDVLLIKPINHRFLLCFRRPNSVQIINVFFAIVLIVIAIPKENLDVLAILLFLLSLSMSIVIMYLVMSTFVYLSFWTVRVGNMWGIVEQFNAISNRPKDIYPKFIKFFLTMIIPSIVMINYPAEVIIFKNYELILTRTLPVLILFCFINKLVFKLGIKKYSGAGG
ncbi:MAG: ABC-2 family transporter protein [Lactobacillus sp.]|nr:ABC-2 family transporter protein [Lactobacillus sp.]